MHTKRYHLQYPEWNYAGRVHDWRNHVPEPVRDEWDSFTEEQRSVLYDWAEALAEAEEWD